MNTPKIQCSECGGLGEVVDEIDGQIYGCGLCGGAGKIEDDTDTDDDSDERNFIGEE